MILIMRTALRAFVPANRVGRFRIMVSSGVALNSEMHADARVRENYNRQRTGNEPFHIHYRVTNRFELKQRRYRRKHFLRSVEKEFHN